MIARTKDIHAIETAEDQARTSSLRESYRSPGVELRSATQSFKTGEVRLAAKPAPSRKGGETHSTEGPWRAAWVPVRTAMALDVLPMAFERALSRGQGAGTLVALPAGAAA